MISSTVELDYTRLVHETDRAYLISFAGKKVWLPKSVTVLNTDDMTVIIPEFIAIEKELV